MRRPLITGLLLAGASALQAQENRATYDAPVVVVAKQTSIDQLADVNGDGRPDALGWYWIDATFPNTMIEFRVHLGLGDGTFSPAVWSSVLPNPAALAFTWELEAGDLNGDAYEDFVFTLNDTVRVYHSNSAGVPNLVATWTEAFAIRGLVVADFDQDGLDDVAVGGNGVILRRNAGASFPVAATHPVGFDLFGGDLNGDALPDLAVALTNSVRVLFVSGATITPGPILVHGILAPLFTCGDVTGNGLDDIVVFSMDEVSVLLEQVAAGSFVADVARPGGPATNLADVDGDGHLDGVCCSSGGPGPPTNIEGSTYRVALGKGDGTFDVAFSITGLGAKRLAGAVDIDQDGDVDLVAGRVVMFNRDSFHRPPQPDFDVTFVGQPLRVADRDGDGDPDVVVDAAASFRDNDGCGGFSAASPVLPPAPAGSWHVGPGIQGDFDGDGDEDLLVARVDGGGLLGMRCFWNAGGGDYVDGGDALPAGVGFALDKFGTYGDRAVTGDVDGDGHLDVLAGNDPFPAETHVWLGNGAGGFTLKSTFWAIEPMALADFDGDGHEDVYTSHGPSGLTFVHFGAGDGTFPSYFLMSTQIHFDHDQVAIADLNGDARLDLVAIDRSANALDVWTNNGDRTFAKNTVPIIVGVSTDSLGSVHVQADDLDADGDVDILMSHPFEGEGLSAIFMNDGSGALVHVVDQVVVAAGLADVDGDGDRDAIGARVVRNARFHVPNDGLREQYGSKTDGLGGMAPTLGASGPFRVGETISLRLTGAPGGSWAVMMLGLSRTELTDWPAPGLTAHAYPPVLSLGFPLGGAANQAGTGSIAIPATVPAAAAGGAFTFQAFVYDQTAPAWWTQTNGLELRFE